MTGTKLSLKLYAWLYREVEQMVNFESWYLDLSSVVSLKRPNNRATRVIPAKLVPAEVGSRNPPEGLVTPIGTGVLPHALFIEPRKALSQASQCGRPLPGSIIERVTLFGQAL